ncbi:MAG: hypothetical protein MRY49_01040 [Candidatus Pacebacteria bacterium]|nr:hypothetical protein [Candidatus Paceibacterota bacterium]
MSDDKQLDFRTLRSEMVQVALEGYLDTLPPDEINKEIDNVILWLQMEKRWRSLTNEERFDILETNLSESEASYLSGASSNKDFDSRLEGLARSKYHRRLAWIGWLKGETDEKPPLKKEPQVVETTPA